MARARVSNGWLFRAEAMRLPWVSIAERMRPAGLPVPDGWDQQVKKRTAGRNHDIHVWWACSRVLGVPREPFLVWTRQAGHDEPKRVDISVVARGDGLFLTWGGIEAAVVEVTFDPVDGKAPSALFVHRSSAALSDTIGAAVAPPAGTSTQTLLVRCSGATSALLVNGSNPRVRIQPLSDVLHDPSWKPLERVGLPCDQPWAGTAYDSSDQGPIATPMPPLDAAVDRLVRGAPPLGWPPLTQTARVAPTWVDADPVGVVKEVWATLLPEIAAMYAATVPERRQYLIEDVRSVPGPTQDGRTSSLDTSATTRPWSMLALPAQTDPLLNLATGFGATYFMDSGERPELSVGGSDFLVTASFERPPTPLPPKVTLAAYAPQVGPHLLAPPPTTVRAERAGLVAPAPPDTPWRESIRVSWDRLPTTAALGRASAGTLARYAAGDPEATSLAPLRDAGGVRPLTLSPDGPPGTLDAGRVAFVDAAADIPILSGGRHVGYAVSLVDIHGLWSAWRDVSYDGTEPGPLPPRLISLELTSRYTGSTSCPATLTLQTALDWTERTPTAVQVVAVFYPMATAGSGPPAGVDPSLPAPAGCFRRDLGMTFTGDVPTGVGATVVTLSPDGDQPMAPGPGQGDGGRRYRLTADIPTLDFSGTLRWGVQVWVRAMLAVGASPTAYTPDAAHPARTSAASPVPVTPLPPPAPPGVPLGSTLDAQGCSHVRVHWSLPAGGAGVRTCVVWECSETALRQRAGLPARAPDTDSPGVRLAALWAAYDAMTPTAQRAAFRRAIELPAAARDTDVTLPKGSTDIHLFTVTTQSLTGIESPWPGPAATGHLHLQAAMAPRLRRPTPPLVRATAGAGGTVSAALYAASRVPVERFLVFATRSEAAARDRESMGPAVADVPVLAAPAGTDPVTGAPVYEASWNGTLTPSWDPWLVRVVAKPVDVVAVQAVRGLPSEASEVTSLVVPPPDPPDLEPLVAARWGADQRGIVVRTSTSAPVRVTASGVHRLSAVADGIVVPLAELPGLPEAAGTTAPAGAGTAAVLERGARAAGRTPLRLWFTTADASAPATVTMRLVDPFGRATERTVTVPGFVAPPAYTVDIVTVAPVAGGVVFGVATDAPSRASAGIVMAVRGTKRSIVPIGPGPFAPRPRTRVVNGRFQLADIPVGVPFFPADGAIHVVALPRGGLATPARYAVFVPLTSPVSVTVSIVSPDGSEVSVTRVG